MRKNNEMLVILKKVMNDLYARDTSNKIKAVKQSTFKIRLQGYGFRKIALQLNAEKNRAGKRRLTKMGKMPMFSGLLY